MKCGINVNVLPINATGSATAFAATAEAAIAMAENQAKQNATLAAWIQAYDFPCPSTCENAGPSVTLVPNSVGSRVIIELIPGPVDGEAPLDAVFHAVAWAQAQLNVFCFAAVAVTPDR